MDEKSIGMIMDRGPPIWKVSVDGVANQRGSGVRLVLESPEGIVFEKSLRSGNTHADSLATLATSSVQCLPRIILVEDLLEPTQTTASAVHVHLIRLGPSWIDPVVSFLQSDVLPEDKSEADKIRRTSFLAIRRSEIV
ncbi:uncharacterized protein LOC142616863 [Castanea sativa]|uniref:uncharacterized protein LOC142616863 n=1 Tax=Castanea sativa TaxID=21020 RepID=UPI003F650292